MVLGFGGLDVWVFGAICLFCLFLGSFCIFGGGMYLGEFVIIGDCRKQVEN